MEGFWGILKAEAYYLNHFEDYEALQKSIYAYIDFYNNHRYREKLGCMMPVEFLAALNKSTEDTTARRILCLIFLLLILPT